MNRTTLHVLFITLLFPLSAWTQPLSGDTYAQASQARKGNIIYTYVTTPGFSQANGAQLEGLAVDVMDAFVAWVRTEKGIVLERSVQTRGNASDFPNFIRTIDEANGGVFGLGNITITEERKRVYHMSAPVIPNVSIMVTNNRVPTLSSLDDLATTFAGYTCYVVEGTTNATRMYKLAEEYYPDLNIVEVKTSEETLERVVADSRSFTNLDFTYYIGINSRGMPLKRHPAGDASDEDLGIIMPRSNDWAPLLDEFLNSGFLQSQEYRTMLSRNLHRDILAILDAL